jgi:molybdenum cofactor guanylyltransferase
VSAVPAFDVTGLVLAGGRGARLGGADKGWVEYRGAPLIRRAIDRLQPQVDTLLVSANRNRARYEGLGLTVVSDDPAHGEFAGPLAGILAGLRATRTRWLAVMPCDAPNAPADFVQRLKGGAPPGTRAAVAFARDRIEPLFCLLDRDLAVSLQAFLDAGEHKVATWLAQAGAVAVPFDDAAAFTNINTHADLPVMR